MARCLLILLGSAGTIDDVAGVAIVDAPVRGGGVDFCEQPATSAADTSRQRIDFISRRAGSQDVEIMNEISKDQKQKIPAISEERRGTTFGIEM